MTAPDLDFLAELRARPHVYPEHEAFLDLVGLAARRPTAVKIGRTTVPLERGELVTSEPKLALRWRWSRKVVRNFLAELRARGELLGASLGSTKQGAGTKLTLVNYETYAPLGPKRAKVENRAKSNGAADLPHAQNGVGAKAPPHTPRGVVQPPLSLERSRPLGGPGGGDASTRGVDNRVDTGVEPPAPQLELPPPIAPVNPEHLAYAEALADALNFGQLENNAGIDRDAYRPVQAWHPRTLEAALAIKNAGVPLLFATTYARTEASKFRPTRAPQIASAAYVQGGCIRAWRELEVHQRARASPSHRGGPLSSVGDLLAGVLPHVVNDRSSS